MIAVRRVSDSSYETGDVVAIVEDGHQFSPRDLASGQRESVNIGAVTDGDNSLLLMSDERFVNVSSAAKIATFKHKLFKRDNLKQIKRRKYNLDGSNNPILKGQ